MKTQSPITRHQSLVTGHQSPVNAVVLKNISKIYTLNKSRPMLVKRFLPQKRKNYHALKNISLTIKKGETIGVTGENGAGKSTLLKLIAGITTPTHGSVTVNGKVASLIELGAGFQPDLTGKENVYLNATLLGMTKKEIDGKYQAIVDFADIGNYIDEPVRTYSSGMIVRLGFSVAIHLDPDILLIDEVLAVGDENFQHKSLIAIQKQKEKNTTIVFISHNPTHVRTVCEKTLWIDHGEIKAAGKTKSTLAKYFSFSHKKLEGNMATRSTTGRYGTFEATIEKVQLFNKLRKRTTTFSLFDDVTVRIFYATKKRIEKPNFGVAIYRHDGIYCYGTNMENDDTRPLFIKDKGYIDLIYTMIPLLTGTYAITAAIYGNTELYIYDYRANIATFTMRSSKNEQGVISMAHTWKISR